MVEYTAYCGDAPGEYTVKAVSGKLSAGVYSQLFQKFRAMLCNYTNFSFFYCYQLEFMIK